MATTHRQLTCGGTGAPGQPGQAQPRREGSAQRQEGGGRTGSRVGGARAVQVYCETSEVTKRPSGPRRAGARGHLPAHAESRRTARLPFTFAWDRVGWVQLETRDPAGLVRSCASPQAGLDSQLLLPSLGISLGTHWASFQGLAPRCPPHRDALWLQGFRQRGSVTLARSLGMVVTHGWVVYTRKPKSHCSQA